MCQCYRTLRYRDSRLNISESGSLALYISAHAGISISIVLVSVGLVSLAQQLKSETKGQGEKSMTTS